MLMGLSRHDKVRQYLSDIGQTQTIVGYTDDNQPIIIDETPVGVTPDDSANFVPPDVTITGPVGAPSAATDAAMIAAQNSSIAASLYSAPDYPIPSSISTSPPPNTSPTDIAKAVSSLVTGGLSAYQTLQLQQMQIQRINQGLPPLTAAQMAGIYPNLPQYSTQQSQTTMLMLFGGAALLLFMMSKKKRHV